MGRFVRSIALVGLAVFFRAPLVGAEPLDCQAARCAIEAEIDAECPCAEARNHGRYLACVVRTVNRAVREKRVPTACRNKINGCFIRSLCGKREATVLCDLPGDGPSGRCRPLLSEDHCTARGGETVSTCCEACDAATPTPSVPGPTSTPGPTTSGAGATASAAIPSATPSTPAATPTSATPPTTTPRTSPTTAASAVPTASAVATATPLVPATPTSVAGTTTAVAPTATTAAPTATAVAPTASAAGPTATAVAPTATAGAPTATAATVSGSVATPTPTAPVFAPSSTATPTARPSLLFVSVDAEPDDGIAPLTVRWTSDVSGGTPPYRYRWSFGDGSVDETSANPTHVYRSVGDFTTTLTVTDARGEAESDDWDVTVAGE